MRIVLHLIFLFGILLSPCSIKANIAQMINLQEYSLGKTSPNKSSEVNTCDKEEQTNPYPSIEREKSKTKVTRTTLSFVEKKNLYEENTTFFSQTQKRGSPRLFLLYSQLKIALF